MKQRREIKFNDPRVILSSDMFYATDVNILYLMGKLGACCVYLQLVDKACGVPEEMFI